MSIETRTFSFTIPAGTPIATPVNAPIVFPARIVREIDIRVPPGPRGEVGFAIGSAGVQVIPVGAGTWIVTDDERIVWPLDGYWDSGSWQVFGYNTGQYPHTLQFVFQLDLPTQPATGVAPLASNASLGSPSNAATGLPAVVGGVLVALPAPTGVIDLAPAPTLAPVPLPPPPPT